VRSTPAALWPAHRPRLHEREHRDRHALPTRCDVPDASRRTGDHRERWQHHGVIMTAQHIMKTRPPRCSSAWHRHVLTVHARQDDEDQAAAATRRRMAEVSTWSGHGSARDPDSLANRLIAEEHHAWSLLAGVRSCNPTSGLGRWPLTDLHLLGRTRIDRTTRGTRLNRIDSYLEDAHSGVVTATRGLALLNCPFDGRVRPTATGTLD